MEELYPNGTPNEPAHSPLPQRPAPDVTIVEPEPGGTAVPDEIAQGSEVPSPAADEVRLACIQAYASESLRAASLLEANLKILNGDMMHTAFGIKQMLDGHLQQPPRTIQEFEEVRPMLDMQLKYYKQIGHFSNLLRKIGGGNEQ